MRVSLLFFFILALLSSCSDSTKDSTKESVTTVEVESRKSDIKNRHDNPSGVIPSSFDSSMTMEEAAKKILAGENYNRWNDSYLLSLIDSLNSKNKTSRIYYFEVFNKIMEKADGYVSEAIGVSALEYISSHTQEFIQWSKDLTPNQVNAWSYHVGVEISLLSQSNDIEGDDMEHGSSYAKMFRQNCKTCNREQKKSLESFITSMLQTAESAAE